MTTEQIITLEWRGANGVTSTVMSELQKHTEFLRQCIRYDESARRHETTFAGHHTNFKPKFYE